MLIDIVRKTISERSMIKAGDTVIAGLSGGADSVCLLLALSELQREMSFSLGAVHVNHCLRGEESDSDMDFCVSLCDRLGIDIKVYRVDVRSYAAEYGKSVEEAARVLRYGAFDEEIRRKGGGLIATAHNKCDNTETVIFNLARGTGIKGICGIPYIRGNIIRPLLDVSREEIEAFLEERGQSFATDSSNFSDDYSRNKIRHRIIPVLSEINPSVHEAVSRLSESAEEDEEYFCKLLMNIEPENVQNFPPSVRKRYIRSVLLENRIECSFSRLCELDAAMISGEKTRFNLSGDVYAVFKGGVMKVERLREKEIRQIEIKIKFDGDLEINIPEFDKTVKISRLCDDNFITDKIINRNLTNNLVNCVKIQGVVLLRNKRDGDCITLKNRSFRTRLKKLYNSLKLPLDERLGALVIEDEEGIIWSEYGGVCERTSVQAGDSPEDIYEISVMRADSPADKA